MLKESIADVERLRADLAENETAFKAQGYPIEVETIQCPNCGSTLELGLDKCEYCRRERRWGMLTIAH